MAIQTMKPASSLRQCWKEQDGTCPARSNQFWCLLSSSGLDCPKLPPPIPFQGPNSSPKNIFGGPKNVTKFIWDRRKSQKMQNWGPEKTFLGRAKSSPKNGNFAPEARGPDRVLARDVASQFMSNFACVRHWELFSWMFICAPVWRMCHLPPKSTVRTKSIRSGTCIRCFGIRGHGNMDEKKTGLTKNCKFQRLQIPYPIWCSPTWLWGVSKNIGQKNSRLKFRSLEKIRRPRSTYKKVVQGKCPLHFIDLNGVVCSNTLFSNTSALTSSLLFRGNSTCKILEHLVWSNTSGFQFWGPLARTNFLSALCGLPKKAPKKQGRSFRQGVLSEMPSVLLGNSMTSSKRPSPKPLLKKEVSPAVLRGRRFWKCSGSFKCLELEGLEDPSRTLEGNSRKALMVFPGSFLNFSSGISSGKSQPYWQKGCHKRGIHDYWKFR